MYNITCTIDGRIVVLMIRENNNYRNCTSILLCIQGPDSTRPIIIKKLFVFLSRKRVNLYC